MKILLLLFLPAILFLNSCMTMHGGNSEMHNNHADDHMQNHDSVHLMDDQFHVNIQIEKTNPMLFLLTVSEHVSGDFAQSVQGSLTVKGTNISSDLTPDIPDKGQYTSLLRLPVDNGIDYTLHLVINDKQGVQSGYEFTIGQMQQPAEQNRRKNLTRTSILVGSGMALMMAGKWLLFGWI